MNLNKEEEKINKAFRYRLDVIVYSKNCIKNGQILIQGIPLQSYVFGMKNRSINFPHLSGVEKVSKFDIFDNCVDTYLKSDISVPC